jgi:threonine dehydratase
MVFSDLRPDDVAAAATRIAAHIRTTPLVHSRELTRLAGGDVWLKCETEQITGSFKLRGALNAIASMPIAVAERGIVASSAGNHGIGIAYASRVFNVSATVFVPRHAPQVKKEGILSLGARVLDSEPDYDAAMAAAIAFAQDTGATFINPCLGNSLLAGQGTVALEIMRQLPATSTVVTPVGGGGLLGGMATLLRHQHPRVRIVGAQSVNTAAMARSIANDRVTEIEHVRTLADGLAGQIDEEALDIGRFSLDEIVTLTEDEIGDAIAWLSREENRVVEGAGSVGAGAILSGRARVTAFPAVVVLSGKNIDPAVHAEVLSRAAVASRGA